MGAKRKVAKADVPWSVIQHSRAVTEVVFSGLKAGWEQWVFLSSDRHHDNPYSHNGIELKHLEQVKARNAVVVDAGDLFCAMQGKYDVRKELGNVRPEHDGVDYLDRLVNTAADFYGPYARNIVLLGMGNHETKILDRCATNLTDRLAAKLRERGGQTAIGGVGGWVVFQFSHGTFKTSRRLKFFHGAAGGGQNFGSLEFARVRGYWPEADFIHLGHSHDSMYLPLKRERLNQALMVEKPITHCIRTSGYKDEYAEGTDGWWVETEKPPKPMGGAWIHFTYEASSHKIMTEVTLTVE